MNLRLIRPKGLISFMHFWTQTTPSVVITSQEESPGIGSFQLQKCFLTDNLISAIGGAVTLQW